MPALNGSAVRQLGRLPHDPAMLARAPQLGGHALGAKRAPATLDRLALGLMPRLDGNDRLSDCTAVAIANSARAAAMLDGYQVAIPTAKVVGFYGQSTGYDGTPATDRGGVLAKVLANQAQAGFDIGAQAPLVGAWGTFDPHDRNLMALAIDELGTVQLGVALSISDQRLGIWDTVVPASAGDSAPGSWGRHAMMAWDYTGLDDKDTVRCGTWGAWQHVTWRWIRARAEEAHSLAWRRFGGAGAAIDYERLVADNELFVGWLAA